MNSKPKSDFLPDSARRFARLVAATAEKEIAWLPEELGALWRHQISSPVTFESLERDWQGPGETQVNGTSPKRGGLSLSEILFQPNPPLERLKLAKEFAKARRHRPSKGFPKEIARVLYFASIVVALLRRQRRITRLSNQDILTGVEWTITQAWLDQRTLGLFREAKEYLLAVGETKDSTP